MTVETANVFFSLLSFAALAVAVLVGGGALVARRSPDGTVAAWIDALQGAGLSRVAFVTASSAASSP